MKILSISDIHSNLNENLFEYLSDNYIDLLIISGDITNFGPLEFVNEFIGKIISLGCEVVAIPGNCDPDGILDAIKESGAKLLHNSQATYDNFIILGYGGSNPTPFDTPFEIDDNKIYDDLKALLEKVNDKNKFKILLTHAPPYDTKADLTSTNLHVGSNAIRKIIEEFKPELNICGHIHEAKSLSYIGDTTIVNPGIHKDNGAVLIEINNNKVDVNLISIK